MYWSITLRRHNCRSKKQLQQSDQLLLHTGCIDYMEMLAEAKRDQTLQTTWLGCELAVESLRTLIFLIFKKLPWSIQAYSKKFKQYQLERLLLWLLSIAKKCNNQTARKIIA